MRRLLLKREIRLICRSVVRFLDRSVCRAMGCFFNCFRTRSGQSTSNLVPHSTRVKSRESAESQNRLSSLFLSEERADSPRPDKGRISLGSIHIEKGLKDEAKFLKACGTIPETPIEIRKATQNSDGSHRDRDSESSGFHSWLPNNSITRFQVDEKLDEPPTPVKVCEELGRHSISSEQTPSSCMTNVLNTGRMSASSSEENKQVQGSVSTALRVEANRTDGFGFPAGNTQGRNRSVRFECDFDVSSSSGSSQNSSTRKPETVGKPSFTATSPNPTPLKLFDEMQTPGTIFPTNLDSLGKGKTRIRSQFVYSFPEPIGNASLSKVPEESCDTKVVSELQDSMEQTEDKTRSSEIHENKKLQETSAEKDMKVEASFSPWLISISTSNEDNNQNLGALPGKTTRFGRTPGDRPIIGMVAAHWNKEEPSHVSPKWWDGNGIPNSTNKYKEDQKVSWHATPFEERLEKALSEESFISQRKNFKGRPVVFEENEGDTAESQLQHSADSKPRPRPRPRRN